MIFFFFTTARGFYVLTCLPYKIPFCISATFPLMSAKDALETFLELEQEEVWKRVKNSDAPL